MADPDAALVEQLLNISVTERKALVQPNRVLNDRHWETLAIGFRIGYGGSTYPNPVQATQPSHDLQG